MDCRPSAFREDHLFRAGLHPDLLPAWVICFFALASAPLAQIQVPDGFTVEQWTIPGAKDIEAIRTPSYGTGVIGAYVSQDTLCLWRSSSRDEVEVFSRFAVVSDMHVDGIRFDRIGTYGHSLLVNLRRGFTETTILTVACDGVVTPRVTFGNSANGMHGELEVSSGILGYAAGAYFYDCHLPQGQPLLHFDVGFNATAFPSTLPAGRSDVDGLDMKVDPLGAYGLYLTLADTDPNDDNLSAIYQLTPQQTWLELVAPTSTALRAFQSLAFGTMGDFGYSLYAADNAAKVVWAVSPTGELTQFASGFESVHYVRLSEDGSQMWVGNATTLCCIYAIQPTDEPRPDPSLCVSLLEPYPNPSDAIAHIRYRAEGNRPFRLGVYDPSGRLVRDLPTRAPGCGVAVWDGRDTRGSPVPPGAYLIRIDQSPSSESVRVVRTP